jgi:hypothetical protein
MKNFAIAISLLASVNSFAQVVYSDSADLSTSTQSHTIVDAEYKVIPTKTTTKKISGCTMTAENYPETCEEVVVLASEAVVTVNVAYTDSTFATEGNMSSFASFNFKLSDFTAEDVAALKAASPAWKHPFSSAGKKFAKKNFSLQVKNVTRTISIVDVRNSQLCPVNGETSEIAAGCVEVLNFKNVPTYVKEVSLIQK